MNSRTMVWVGIIFGTVVLAAGVFAIFFYNPKLTVITNPGDATLAIDGQPAPVGVPLKLKPGTITVVAKTDGYLTEKEELRLRPLEIRNLTLTMRQIPTVQPLQGGVQFPAVVPTSREIVYLGNNGRQFFQIDAELGDNGTAPNEAISDARFADISRITWSPARSLAVIEHSNGQTTLFDFARYDFTTQEERELPAHIRAAVWHPTESTLVFFINEPGGERSLIRYRVDTGMSERLIDLRDQPLTNPELAWSPDGRTILLVEDRLSLFDVQTRTLNQVVSSETARAATWSPSSQQILAELMNGLTLFALTEGVSGGRLGRQTPLMKTTWTHDGTGLIVATSSDQGYDELVRIDATNLKETQYRYRTTSPITM
ncbi:hypothetical protein HY523_00620 [Candidatus Berkelbacteria bacterium]|nr:hypothetical protein [Candidatus Berkelbacteria bacterium]